MPWVMRRVSAVAVRIPMWIAAMAAAKCTVSLRSMICWLPRAALIRRCTTAESGIVTERSRGGADAGRGSMFRGKSARPDGSPARIRRWNCPRNEIIYPAAGPFDYDHAIRLSGAKLVSIDYRSSSALEQIEQSINSRTAAIGYVWYGIEELPDLKSLIELAHRHDLPVIVDGAFSMLPVENLTAFSRYGADLVAYSGGKHLGGPQASGILCGREDLIRGAAWVQMVDMDVRAGTWSLQHWITSGWIPRPPRHGIGRSMKVSKESMIGLMTALERYSQRDHAAEQAAWKNSIDLIYERVRDLNGLRMTRLDYAANGQPYPLLKIESGSSPDGLRVRDLILALRSLPRKILLSEDEQSSDRACVYSQCFQPGDAEYVAATIRQFILSRGQRDAFRDKTRTSIDRHKNQKRVVISASSINNRTFIHMPTYFKPLRRKLGVVTLVMACVFAVGWVRGQIRYDEFRIFLWKATTVQLSSSHSGIELILICALMACHFQRSTQA